MQTRSNDAVVGRLFVHRNSKETEKKKNKQKKNKKKLVNTSFNS